eukprot:UN24960
MAELAEAYDTLKNEHKREIYDQTFGSFDTINSEAVELNNDMYDEMVLNSSDMWVIEVYAEWYPMCKQFSPVWDDVVRGLGQYIKFGRVHSSRESSLVRRLPVPIRVHPTVFSMKRGKLINTYDLVRVPRELMNKIISDFPNYSLHSDPKGMATMKSKMHRRSKFVNALVLVTKKTTTNILMKGLAEKYYGAMQVAVAHPKEGSSRTRFLHQSLEEVFGLETLPSLPAVFIYSNGKSDWVDQKNYKENIENVAKAFLAKRVLRFTDQYLVIFVLTMKVWSVLCFFKIVENQKRPRRIKK